MNKDKLVQSLSRVWTKASPIIKEAGMVALSGAVTVFASKLSKDKVPKSKK